MDSQSWEDTVWHQRTQLTLLLEESPSLRGELPVRLERHYPLAKRDTTRETRLLLATFPNICPWTIEQILDEDFWPES